MSAKPLNWFRPRHNQCKSLRSSRMAPALLVLLLLCAACAQEGGGGSDDDSSIGGESDSGSGIGIDIGDDSDDSAAVSARRLRVTTYNVGLLPAFVPQTDERLAPLLDRLANDTSDVLCLQELWRDSDRQAVEQRLRARFPFSMRASARQKTASRSPVCTLADLEPIAECVLSSCGFDGQDILGCATNSCRGTIFELASNNPECAAALFAQSGRSANDILSIQEELLSDSATAGLFAFGGDSGTLLLSRFPLEDQQLVDFFDISTTSRRVALLASIQGEQASYRVACTHLTSNLDGVLPYTGPFGSWGSETSAQAERLLAEVGGIERVLLAGDFNCSQANGDTGAEQDLASVCQTIRASGFSDLAAEQLRCSYCNENILNQLKQNLGEQQDLVLDHVFSRGITAVSGAELLYDEIIQIAGGNSQLSDHYAVSIVYATP